MSEKEIEEKPKEEAVEPEFLEELQAAIKDEPQEEEPVEEKPVEEPIEEEPVEDKFAKEKTWLQRVLEKFKLD